LAVEAVSEVDRFGQDEPLRSMLERYNSRERDFTKLDLNATVLDFRGVHPRRAKFVRANVKTCDFRDADLRHANLQDTSLEGPPFAGTKLDGATFFGAGMYSHRFTEDEKPDWSLYSSGSRFGVANGVFLQQELRSGRGFLEFR
jgi:hypothetical protein